MQEVAGSTPARSTGRSGEAMQKKSLKERVEALKTAWTQAGNGSAARGRMSLEELIELYRDESQMEGLPVETLIARDERETFGRQ